MLLGAILERSAASPEKAPNGCESGGQEIMAIECWLVDSSPA